MRRVVQVLVAGHGVYGGDIAIFNMPQFSSSIFTMGHIIGGA
jgi:hypothetical protein